MFTVDMLREPGLVVQLSLTERTGISTGVEVFLGQHLPMEL